MPNLYFTYRHCSLNIKTVIFQYLSTVLTDNALSHALRCGTHIVGVHIVGVHMSRVILVGVLERDSMVIGKQCYVMYHIMISSRTI